MRVSSARLTPATCRSTSMAHTVSFFLPIDSSITLRSHMVARLDLSGSIRRKITRASERLRWASFPQRSTSVPMVTFFSSSTSTCMATWCRRAFSRVDTNHDRSRAHTNLYDAAWLAFESARDEAVFGVHDGRHAGRDRHAHVEGVATLHRDEEPGKWLTGPPGPRMSPRCTRCTGIPDMDLSRRSLVITRVRRRGPSRRLMGVDLCCV